ncbi:MAG: hypothetical protein VR64_14540 [Desulfatitalea sp. BRH_c12]|jgi:type IV secretory pathway VirB2 component (pilin)|nr:MAG: hypothetical protein VR64_14540 [Desulfatitalea sp. BRH_c12]
MNHIKSASKALAINLLCAAPLFAGYNIESAGSTNASIFTRLVGFMQDIVDLMDGPIAIAVVIGGVIIAGCLWIFAPDNRHLGKAMKAIAVGFFLFDIGLIVNYMRA